MASPYYVYAVLARETTLPAGLTGFGGAALCVVPCRALAAVTSILDSAEPSPTSENLLRHEAVVESLRSAGPALPVRFGTVLANQDMVTQALAARYTVLSADLARLGDKVELGLAVLWDREELADTAPSEHHARTTDVERSPCSGPGVRYLMGHLARHRREMFWQSRASRIAQELDGMLHRYALESRRTLLPTPRLALRATYLVEPSRVEAFREAFEEIRQAHPRLRLLLTGPWPPYSFVTPPDTLVPALSGDPLGRL